MGDKQQKLDEGFLLDAYANAAKSRCLTRHVGALLALYDLRISDGYNGTPRGIRNCDEGGCPRCNDPAVRSGQGLEQCLCVHAEKNAIFNAFVKGASLWIPQALENERYRQSTLYVTTSPCMPCAVAIIQVGIHRVVYDEAYAGVEKVTAVLADAGIKCLQLPLDREKKDAAWALWRP